MDGTMTSLNWIYFGIITFMLPPLVLGFLRKTKARLQNRIGASILQPYYDLYKLFCKGETVSDVASWIFRNTAAINLAIIFLIAICLPWLSFKPICVPCQGALVPWVTQNPTRQLSLQPEALGAD
jgi:formate hydrogenlyase subunit 4